MTDIDTVRLLIGDTDATNYQLGTADIQGFLDSRAVLNDSGGTVYNTVASAADCAGALAAKYANQFNFAEDGQSFQVAQKFGHYQALEKTLRARAGGVTVRTTLAGTANTT